MNEFSEMITAELAQIAEPEPQKLSSLAALVRSVMDELDKYDVAQRKAQSATNRQKVRALMEALTSPEFAVEEKADYLRSSEQNDEEYHQNIRDAFEIFTRGEWHDSDDPLVKLGIWMSKNK